jgi:hypothetical protein
MAELKYLDSPKMNEEQAINLITKHFSTAIQAYIQTAQEKTFLSTWEKLGKLENNYNKQYDHDQQKNQDTVSQTKRTPRNNQTQQFISWYGQNNF